MNKTATTSHATPPSHATPSSHAAPPSHATSPPHATPLPHAAPPPNTTPPSNAARLLTSLALLAVAGIFLYAGISKITAPADFARAIELYRIVPGTLAAITALYLPWLEIGCAFAIFIRALRGGALALLTLCSTVFTAAIASALVRGLDISCGCFGADGATGRTALLISLARAALLALVCGALFLRHARATAAAQTANPAHPKPAPPKPAQL
jgi:hypothetical protein